MSNADDDWLLRGDEMKAIVYEKHGGPEVLEYREVPEPRIGADEVLVRVRACALNHLDLFVREGWPGLKLSMPHIPGSDIAGEVARVGAGVTRVKAGERVLLAPLISCGKCEKCAAGEDNRCPEYRMIGEMVDGGCAEFVAAPEENVFPIPAGLSFEEAASVPLVFLTAWHMLMTRAKLKPAETVLVLGATSGVGSAAIQIAKVAGARVITTAGSERKLEFGLKLGADEGILHSTQKISAEVKRLTGGRGVDVVVEHVGTATWDQSVASLKKGGRLVTCGATTGYDAHVDLRFLFFREYSLLGSFMGSRAEMHPVLELFSCGKLRPVVDEVMPLEKAVEAHRKLESREQFGKIVLKVG